MRHTGLLTTVVALATLLLSAPAAIAACERYPTVAEAVSEADYVFVAQVTAGRMDLSAAEPGEFDGVEYTVRSLRAFKGDPPDDLLLYSENSSGRFPMAIAGWYLLFVNAPYAQGFATPPRVERAVSTCGPSFALNTVPLALQSPPTDLSFDQLMAFAPPITALVERAEGCTHFSGEEPYDEARRAQIEDALADLRCETLEQEIAGTRARFDGAPEAQARLDRAAQGDTTTP